MEYINIEESKVLPAWCVGPRSFFTDRAIPVCEMIALSAARLEGGTLRYAVVEDLPISSRSLSFRERLGSIRRRLREAEPRVIRHNGELALDLRLRSPQNWAHFLTNHAPLTLELTHNVGIDLNKLRIVLPTGTPRYVREAADLMGMKAIYTDAEVRGPGIVFDIDYWGALRPMRVEWVRKSGVSAKLHRQDSGSISFPKQVFIPRRDTRKLTNQDEIEKILKSHGFITIYPESLTVSDQFNLLNEAERIVAIHGAGLAPLLYRSKDRNPGRLIELQPCGIVSTVFRAIAERVGCHWVGVRGKIESKYLPRAYQLKSSFLSAYCNDDFEIDPASLEVALQLSEHWERPILPIFDQVPTSP